MKNLAMIFAVAAISFFSVTLSAQAFPYIEVEGFSNPYAGTVTKNATTTIFSRVDYFFLVTDSGDDDEMNSLKVEFEPDVFASVGSIFGVDPSDWTVSPRTTSKSFYEIFSAGTTLGKGEVLAFSLLNVEIFNAALLDPSIWQEGQLWSHSWTAGSVGGEWDGGSTALVYEPGTLVLLGSGLAGLVVYARRKKCLISI